MEWQYWHHQGAQRLDTFVSLLSFFALSTRPATQRTGCPNIRICLIGAQVLLSSLTATASVVIKDGWTS